MLFRRNRDRTIALITLIFGSLFCTSTHAFSQARLQTTASQKKEDAIVASISLDGLVRISLAQNPRLNQGALSVSAAQARAFQSGLYPNPTIGFNFDELGDRTGPRGINTLPLVTQEFVTGGKLSLNRAAACRDVDLASLSLSGQRATLLASVRVAYFELLVLQQKIELLRQLTGFADQSVEQSQKLLTAKLVARLDLVQLEVEAERLRTEFEAAEKELAPARKRLAAIVGSPELSIANLSGVLTTEFPEYDLERLIAHVLQVHPERQAALVSVERARLIQRRAEVDPIPNVSVSAGYVRQNQNRSNDWTIGFSMPLPLWNRNPGNIRAAKFQVAEATQGIAVVENDLTDRVSTAYRDFVAAKRRVERYQTAILPRAKETYDLSVKAYQGGQFEYLRVLESQRSLAQANLDFIRVLGDAWRAASQISGLTLEEDWPPKAVAKSSVKP